ncbi:glycosyltransferase (plasmid) [Telmatobacter bradus]|uniref:glycosyltransferase n=1 Tax=Telmatobacter bradus TaxID=474953 RepID=UPI003B42C08D
METHLMDLAAGQVGHANVRVIVSNSTQKNETSVLSGVDVTRVARWGIIASMPVCPGLISALRHSPADLVHLHAPNPGAAFAYLLSGHRGKLVITHHADTLGRKVLRKLSDGFVKKAMGMASAIIVTSQRYLDSSLELEPYKEKCHVIPLGIDTRQITANSIESGLTQHPRHLVAVGRLVPYKGFDVLIRAMHQVDAHLTVVGTGPQAQELQALIDVLNLNEKVSLVGRVDDLKSYLHSAAIFVMPSITRAEAFGIVQLEAMAAGLPVVNTDIDSGVPEISLHRETGLTVPPGDAPALAEAINLLLSSPDLRRQYGKAAQERVLRMYSVDKMLERTLAVYGQVLGAS